MKARVFYGSTLTQPLNNRSNVFGMMHTVQCGLDGIPTVRFGAVLRNRESYGAVRCGFHILEMLRCGLVRFSEIVHATVRSGAVFRCREPYGAVQCGFPISKTYGAAMRFSRGQKSHGSVGCG